MLRVRVERKLQSSFQPAFLVHDIHEQINNAYAKIKGQTLNRRRVGSFARAAGSVGRHRWVDQKPKRARTNPARGHPPADRSGAEGEGEISPEDIEKSIKRSLSEAELVAVSRLRRDLPRDRRKQKKILRQACEKARKDELRLKAKK